jgi:glucosamine-6-phosphate deaminase
MKTIYRNIEKIKTQIYDDSSQASKAVANEIVEIIKAKARKGEYCTLGLATGSSPMTVYNELVRLHKEENVSFKNVITFNLDEYYPMPPEELQSYVRFMNEYLFNNTDIQKENINIPDGTIPKERIDEYCRLYEQKIRDYGGIDIQILGIGRTGHIGFNEPGAGIDSRTRLVTLDNITKIDAASDFFGEENVPHKAVTMGVGSILDAKRIILLAWGEKKASVVKEAVESTISDEVPATYLQNHKNTTFIIDTAAGAELTRLKTPWLLGHCDWNEELVRKAVIWLSLKIKKPILKLTNRDYNEHGMGDIITEFDTAYNINIRLFNHLQHTITGWPGGKPNADDMYRPERAKPAKKRVLVFSPHPDDDVISMGGTLIRLRQHKHDVHVAYQTSGNISVFDDNVIWFTDFVNDFQQKFNITNTNTNRFVQDIKNIINRKTPGEIDNKDVLNIKTIIRRSEAKAACRYVGIKLGNIHFLDLPFYETGLVKKSELSKKDVTIIVELLRSVRPHQIFAAGDLTDPHGTHRVCLQAIRKGLEICKKDDWLKNCFIWLYRGAWQEWGIGEIEMAVPLSPDELLKKRRAIFKHQSQKDRPLFPGHDMREFWQRSEARNRHTAHLYDKLGLAEYEAIEAFKKFKL